MGLGLNLETGGGDFMPVLKYNAKAGKWFATTREDGETYEDDVTRSIENDGFICDLENIETGTIHFAAKTMPEFNVTPLHEPVPPAPHSGHKQGVRFIVKLHPKAGGDLREVASTAKVFLQGVNALHNDYEAGIKDNPGMVPLVKMIKTTVITTEGKDKDGKPQKSTNFAPVFEIVKWVKRPADLVPMFRAPKAPAPAQERPAQEDRRGPASTGSTRADPPRQRAPQSEDSWDDGPAPPKQSARAAPPQDDDEWG
jgi:hypothetical protein